MGLRRVHCLASLLVLLLFCHGRGADQGAKEAHDDASRQLSGVTAKLESEHDMPELDVSTPLVTSPVVNPTTPTVTTPTAMPMTPASATPSLANPVGGGGGSWCVASQSASPTAVQVALDYACGQGGADCSAIQSGGSCFNPDTVRDHASYAFNNFYQKNPVQTSCDFGGTALLTSTNPSTSTCQYPATSTGASVLNTSTPTTPTFGSPGYENSPPGYGNSPPLDGFMSPPDYGDNISAAAAMPGSKGTGVLSLTCFLVATVSLNLGIRDNTELLFIDVLFWAHVKRFFPGGAPSRSGINNKRLAREKKRSRKGNLETNRHTSTGVGQHLRPRSLFSCVRMVGPPPWPAPCPSGGNLRAARAWLVGLSSYGDAGYMSPEVERSSRAIHSSARSQQQLASLPLAGAPPPSGLPQQFVRRRSPTFLTIIQDNLMG